MIRYQSSLRSLVPPTSLAANAAKTCSTFRIRQTRYESSSTTTATSSTKPATTAKEVPKPNVYKQFGRPFFKVFLGAMLSYQVLYWGWEKMRLDEIKREKTAEIKSLEKQVEEYRLSKGTNTMPTGKS